MARCETSNRARHTRVQAASRLLLPSLRKQAHTHLIATRPHISCLRGTINRTVRVMTTLYDTGAGRPAWHNASSWLAAVASSAAVVLQHAITHEEQRETPLVSVTHSTVMYCRHHAALSQAGIVFAAHPRVSSTQCNCGAPL